MSLVNLNKMSDHVYKKVYDLDVYFTPDNNKVVANVIVFPEKYLEGSPLYSEKYFNILSNDYKLDKIIYNTASYYGYSKNVISDIKFTVSKVWGDYLTNYVRQCYDPPREFPRLSNSRVPRLYVFRHRDNRPCFP